MNDTLTKSLEEADLTLKSEFLKGSAERETLNTNCERYAGWTLPHIFPVDEEQDVEFQYDYQSLGAQLTNNLSAKMMMTMFQPTKPFFKLKLTKEQTEEIASTGMSSAEVDANLAQVERDCMSAMSKKLIRSTFTDAMKLLIVTGNCLTLDDRGTTQVYSIRNYTVKRNLRQEILQVTVRESITVSSLEYAMQRLLLDQGYHDDDIIAIYTGIKRIDKDKYMVWQELEDLCYCHKKVGFYTKDTLPYEVLVWDLPVGKNYGVGLVEQYSGDFHSLSRLAQVLDEFGNVVTDVKNLVDPTSMIDVKKMNEAASGEYIHGKEGDVFSYSPDVADATKFLEHRYEVLARRLSAVFLFTTGVTRDKERVTATEIRMQAQEFAGAHGGVYSRLSEEWQLPLARRLLREQGKIFAEIDPVIITGFESLARDNDLNSIRAFLEDLLLLSELPDEVKARLEFNDMIAMFGAGHGVEYSKFLKSEEKVAQEQEQRMQQQAKLAGMEAEQVTKGQNNE